MTRLILSSIAALSIVATASVAQDGEATPRDPEAFRIAEESGICGEAGVFDAFFQEDGSVGVQCNEATAFVPLVGGLGAGPALLAGAGALLLGAAGGGGSTPDTQ